MEDNNENAENHIISIDELIAQSQREIDAFFAAEKARVDAAIKRINSVSQLEENLNVSEIGPQDSGYKRPAVRTQQYSYKKDGLNGLGAYVADGLTSYGRSLAKKAFGLYSYLGRQYYAAKTRISKSLSNRKRNLRRNRIGYERLLPSAGYSGPANAPGGGYTLTLSRNPDENPEPVLLEEEEDPLVAFVNEHPQRRLMDDSLPSSTQYLFSDDE